MGVVGTLQLKIKMNAGMIAKDYVTFMRQWQQRKLTQVCILTNISILIFQCSKSLIVMRTIPWKIVIQDM
jgi:hypothetical protein